MKLTKNQREIIAYMQQGSGFYYGDRHDRTLTALERRSLIYWRTAGRYGKSHWALTTEGTTLKINA